MNYINANQVLGNAVSQSQLKWKQTEERTYRPAATHIDQMLEHGGSSELFFNLKLNQITCHHNSLNSKLLLKTCEDF